MHFKVVWIVLGWLQLNFTVGGGMVHGGLAKNMRLKWKSTSVSLKTHVALSPYWLFHSSLRRSQQEEPENKGAKTLCHHQH